MDQPCNTAGQTIPELRIDAAAGLRIALETLIVGDCEDCEGLNGPITGLDKYCRCEILDSDGSVSIHLYHAHCIGCDLSEQKRQEGCRNCSRVVGGREIPGPHESG